MQTVRVNNAIRNLLMSEPPSWRDRARAAGIVFNSNEGTQNIISESRFNLKNLRSAAYFRRIN